MKKSFKELYPYSSALFNDEHTRRYILTRHFIESNFWCKHTKEVVFIGLNPSTADDKTDDPTIRRCANFARQWGFTTLSMLNLFDWIDTDPKGLTKLPEGEQLLSPLGEAQLYTRLDHCNLIIAAWGSNKLAVENCSEVVDYCKSINKPILCLKKTRAGHPSHPLYLKSSLLPIPWP